MANYLIEYTKPNNYLGEITNNLFIVQANNSQEAIEKFIAMLIEEGIVLDNTVAIDELDFIEAIELQDLEGGIEFIGAVKGTFYKWEDTPFDESFDTRY